MVFVVVEEKKNLGCDSEQWLHLPSFLHHKHLVLPMAVSVWNP